MIARSAASSLSNGQGVDMLVRAPRLNASFCIALLALNMIACAHIERKEAQTIIEPTGGSVPMDNVVGVTLKDGRDIRFDSRSRPAVRGDSLHAEVGHQPLAIPVSDLQHVWVQSISTTRTTILVVVGVIVIGMISSLSSNQGGF
jgi:hypothetical protein